MKRMAVVLVLCFLLSGCSYAASDNMTTTPQTENAETTQWNPFVGSFEYDVDRIFLQAVPNLEITEYNLAYKYRDGSIEILIDNVSEYTTFKLIDQRLYYVAWGTLYARDLPDGENLIFDLDRSKYARVVTILDVQEDHLYCGVEKWESTSDPTSLDGKILVGSRIFVDLNFNEYYEDESLVSQE